MNYLLNLDGKTIVGEFAWKSQKGDWDFFRVDGQLRAIFRKDVICLANVPSVVKEET